MNNANRREFKLQYFKELISTNSYIKNNLENFKSYETVWAENQTGGRGRFDRVWYSLPNKDLTFSFCYIVEEKLKEFLPNITQIVAIAIGQSLEKFGIEYKIKWPNDILVQDYKLSGILVEGIAKDNSQTLVIGIGLNVNSCRRELLDEIPAISIFDSIKREVNREELLKSIVYNFMNLIDIVKKEGLSSIINKLNQKLAYKNEQKIMILDNKRVNAQIISVTKEGLLKIKRDNIYEDIISGEISFRD